MSRIAWKTVASEIEDALAAEAAWLKAQADKDGDRDYMLRAIAAEDGLKTARRIIRNHRTVAQLGE